MNKDKIRSLNTGLEQNSNKILENSLENARHLRRKSNFLTFCAVCVGIGAVAALIPVFHNFEYALTVTKDSYLGFGTSELRKVLFAFGFFSFALAIFIKLINESAKADVRALEMEISFQKHGTSKNTPTPTLDASENHILTVVSNEDKAKPPPIEVNIG